MSKKGNYISTNRSKHYLKCHLIFVCKYRKPMLIGQLNDDIKKSKETRGNKQIKSELIQIGAMVVRYLDNLC
jgi:REP element-mobilizing transposase RayT